MKREKLPRLTGTDLLKAVLEKFDYKSETGVFLYKKPWGKKRIGDVAGCTSTIGYRVLWLKGYLYLIHILVYLVENGFEAKEDIDHRDLNRANNHISNLRACSHSDNCSNASLRKHNTSGYKGVSWRKHRQKWESYITVKGKKTKVGYHDDLLEAAKAADDARRLIQGEFYFNPKKKKKKRSN